MDINKQKDSFTIFKITGKIDDYLNYVRKCNDVNEKRRYKNKGIKANDTSRRDNIKD